MPHSDANASTFDLPLPLVSVRDPDARLQLARRWQLLEALADAPQAATAFFQAARHGERFLKLANDIQRRREAAGKKQGEAGPRPAPPSNAWEEAKKDSFDTYVQPRQPRASAAK
jgi:hypothetical protein